jgi:ADP-ribose pyrophosphatase YjhB (NUDIX family)
MQTTLASPFYRVTAKAIVLDEQGRVLVMKNHKGNWELPGGGWEHDEGFSECLIREIREELGVGVETVGDILFIYRGENRRKGFKILRIVAPVTLSSNDFKPDDGIIAAKFVDKSEFMGLDLLTEEGSVQEFADIIWPEG